MTELARQSDVDRPRGELVAVEASERDAQVTIAKHFAGPEDYVTVVARGAFTWAIYVERGEADD